MQASLTKFYQSITPDLLKALPSGRQISSPIFLSVKPEYESAKRRLVIVGQETHSWYGLVDDLKPVDDPVKRMQTVYEKFGLGQSHRRSLFCRVMHDIQKKLEPFVPPLGFMWGNLFSCDENKRTPSNEIGDILRRFRILPNEVAILRPHAVIFLTGPRYDYTINALFPGYSCKEFAANMSKRELAQLTHMDLPPLTFRTYHPNSLRRQRKMHYIGLITKAIKSASVAEGQSS